jgi:uncharacterized protein YgfB (UPF0149 family)
MAGGSSPNFDVLDGALRQLAGGSGAAEAHGELCGLACLLGTEARDVWTEGLFHASGESAEDVSASRSLLRDMASETCVALADGDMSFQPVLPPDDEPLLLRAEGLAEWCAGFLHGLGEAAGNTVSGAALDREIAREIMNDLGDIARLTLGDEDADLEAETAYTELVEFVRASVQLMFEELQDVRRRLAAASMH